MRVILEVINTDCRLVAQTQRSSCRLRHVIAARAWVGVLRRVGVLALAMLLSWHALPAQSAEPTIDDSGDVCVSCHDLSAHVEEWAQSIHFRNGVTCTSCHVQSRQSSWTPADGSGRPATCPDVHESVLLICPRCHEDVGQAFRASPHFKKTSTDSATPICTDCHSPAGGSILSGEAIPQRCATCHNANSAVGAAWVTQKAPELLRLLRQVTLARALDRERLEGSGRLGNDLPALESELRAVDARFRDIPSEWQRFNFRELERRARDVLSTLQSLYDRLEQPPVRSEPEPRDSESVGPAATPRGLPLRFAVASAVSPVATYEEYRRLFADLAQALGRPYEFIQRRTYREINELVLRGQLDLAFIYSGGYAALPRNAPIDLIAVPVVKGKNTYHSLIVVPRDSGVQRFEDLEGLRFAYTDPLSNTGHLYVVFRLKELGKDPERFFASTVFSGSHDQSLLAVQRGLVDAAAVNELVYDRLVVPRSRFWNRFRIIETSSDFGMPPVVAPMAVPQPLRSQMREFLLHLADTAEGRERLATLGFDRFVSAGSEVYVPVRKIREAAGAKSR